MTDSTARAERYEPDAPVLPSYTWTVPQKPVAVRIPLAVIEKLERETVESYRSLTSRGSEIGGLLFGAVAPGNPALVEIESYEAVPCEYAAGPLYHLSEAEMLRLNRTLEERCAAGMRPVGFFRSQTRKGLSLDASDLALLDSRFTGAYDIALLVRPSATKSSMAGIFIREDGKIRSDASYLEFPFRAAAGEAKETNTAEGSVAGPRTVPAAPAAPMAPKPAVRAQIVPIASRREIMPMPAGHQMAPEPLVEASVAEPEPVAPKAAAQPAPPAAMKAEPPVEKPAPPAAKKAEPPVEKPAPPAAKKAEPPVERPAAPAAKPPVERPAAPAAKKAEPPVERPAAPTAKKAEPPVEKPATPAAARKEEAPVEKLAPKPIAKEETAEAADEAPVARSSSKLLWVALGVVASVVLVGGLLFTSGMLRLRNRTLPVSTAETGLALRIERNAGDILLTWNRDAEAIKHASRAVLAINDGPQHENVEMDLSQLRTGSIVYSPVTSDVVFQMEITAAGQSQPVSETVRVLRTHPSPMPDQTPATPTQAQAAPKPAAPPANGAGAPPAPTAEEDVAEQPKEEKVALAQALKPFRADSLAQRLRPTRPEEAPDAPVSAAPVPTVAAVNLGGIVGSTVAPPPSAPKSTPAPAPAPKMAPGGQIQQAELVRRRDPEYPKLARESGASGIVELTATVGTDGHVKAVKVVRGHPLLRQAAVDAVKQWIYRPTILNGSPVETQTQVLLNFKAER
jgi:periplasmic protein TonB